ncbi:MAG TPA: VanW family protein [Candidatus Faecousia intestinigallinarum]|nr:VanW family protein [Candidatus Faecousia intestinigallinarum]
MGKYEKKKTTPDRKKKTTFPEVTDADMEESYRALVGKPKKEKKSGVIALCVAAGVALVALAAGIFFLLRPGDGKIPSGVTAAGVHIGGMTSAEAAQALEQATRNSYPRTPMTIQVGEEAVELSPADTGARLDVEAVVAAAMDLPGGDAQVMDILPYLGLNKAVIQEAADDLAARYQSEFHQTEISFTGEIPEEITPETPAQNLTIILGTPGYALDGEALYTQILAAYNNNLFTVSYALESQEPERVDLDALWEQYCVDAVDAVMDAQTAEITPETYGYGFDREEADAMLAAAQPGETVNLVLQPIVPAVTEESLNGTLFQDALASYRSSYDAGNTARSTNLRLACEAIDGLVLQPGETFSFNGALGERTESKGYRPVYENGDTVERVGGGVSQVSSALYYCALLADLEILQRESHTFVTDYMPYGMDAAVDNGNLDLQFRNNTTHPIRIEAGLDGGDVQLVLMGTDDRDYYVEMEYKILHSYDYDTVYQEMEPDNEEGYADGDEIVSPYTGYYVETYRCRYDKAAGELLSRRYEDVSEYESRDQVLCRIKVPETAAPIDPSDILIGGGVAEDPGD